MEVCTSKIGETNYSERGRLMTIIEFNNSSDVLVEFDNGYKTRIQYGQFRGGNVRNPYDKTTIGVGYIGEGKYKPCLNGIGIIQYQYWADMIKRCYGKEYHKRQPTYIDCTTCEEWHNYQVFAEWFDNNYYKVGEERMHLDKDILVKGNRIYSPTTCIFVPQRINELFTDKNKRKKNNLPAGISYYGKKFKASMSIKNGDSSKLLVLGVYDTVEEAFQAYKQEKEKYIKQVADEYKDKIPKKLYKAMYRWEMNYQNT